MKYTLIAFIMLLTACQTTGSAPKVVAAVKQACGFQVTVAQANQIVGALSAGAAGVAGANAVNAAEAAGCAIAATK